MINLCQVSWQQYMGWKRERRVISLHLKKVHGTDHSLCVCVCVCVCGDGLTLCNGVDRNLRNCEQNFKGELSM